MAIHVDGSYPRDDFRWRTVEQISPEKACELINFPHLHWEAEWLNKCFVYITADTAVYNHDGRFSIIKWTVTPEEIQAWAKDSARWRVPEDKPFLRLVDGVRFIGDGFFEVRRAGVVSTIRDEKDLTEKEREAMQALWATVPPGGTAEYCWTTVI